MVEETLCPVQAKLSGRACNGVGDVGPEEPYHGRDGQCGSPPSPLLVCAGSGLDRSDDRGTLEGPKISRLSSGLV
jgi:hypothetical protein